MRQSISTWRLRVGPAVAVMALLALTVPGVAPGSSDPCTQTLSNAGTSTGSSVRDVICGTSGNDTLLGRGGNDELRGFGGDDDLNGGIGNDELFGAGGKDRLDGESGNDTLNGSSGNDVLEGGSADDVLTGGTGDDTYLAGSGDDKILARDGENDGPFGLSTCGDGTDSIDMDLADAVVTGAFVVAPLAVSLTCEKITIGAVNEGPNVGISRRSRRVSRTGLTTVRIRCPRSLSSRCRGRLKLQLASRRSLRRRAARTRYSIRPGTSRSVSVRLSRSDRRTLRRRRRARGPGNIRRRTGQPTRKEDHHSGVRLMASAEPRAVVEVDLDPPHHQLEPAALRGRRVHRVEEESGAI